MRAKHERPRIPFLQATVDVERQSVARVVAQGTEAGPRQPDIPFHDQLPEGVGDVGGRLDVDHPVRGVSVQRAQLLGVAVPDGEANGGGTGTRTPFATMSRWAW